MPTYRTSQLAKIAGVHPNTVRLYERIGFISPAEREPNGYRAYDERHVLQIKVCRCIYDHGWIGRDVRAASLLIIETLHNWDLGQARDKAQAFLDLLESQLSSAKQTAEVLERWARRAEPLSSPETLSMKQVAGRLGVTDEVVRNWERNGLVEVPRTGPNHARAFTDREIERLRIVQLLRQANYSIAAIRASFAAYDSGDSEGIIRALNSPAPDEDASWICVGDRVVEALESAIVGAKQIPELLSAQSTSP